MQYPIQCCSNLDDEKRTANLLLIVFIQLDGNLHTAITFTTTSYSCV